MNGEVPPLIETVALPSEYPLQLGSVAEVVRVNAPPEVIVYVSFDVHPALSDTVNL